MHTHEVLTFCTTLVDGDALLTRSAHAIGVADEKTPSDGSWLMAKTRIALFADTRVTGSSIHVETPQGLVVVCGTVDSDAAKQLDGAKSAKNDLTERRGSTP